MSRDKDIALREDEREMIETVEKKKFATNACGMIMKELETRGLYREDYSGEGIAAWFRMWEGRVYVVAAVHPTGLKWLH